MISGFEPSQAREKMEEAPAKTGSCWEAPQRGSHKSEELHWGVQRLAVTQ